MIAQYNNKLNNSNFKKYDQTVNSAQELTQKGAIRFSGNIADGIILAGDPLAVGKSLTIAPGEYSYQATFNNACNQSETVAVKKGEESVIELKEFHCQK